MKAIFVNALELCHEKVRLILFLIKVPGINYSDLDVAACNQHIVGLSLVVPAMMGKYNLQ